MSRNKSPCPGVVPQRRGSHASETGPIIRISPHELHVNDAAFFDTLYNRQEGIVWDRYDWAVDAFAQKGALPWTVDHTVHKNRRQPVSPFFSKVKVSNQQDMIVRHAEVLFGRLSRFSGSRETVDLGAAFTAFVRDVINEYLFGKHYNDLAKEEFDPVMVVAAQAAGLMWRISKFIRFFGPVMQSIPPRWIMAVSDPIMKAYFRFMLVSRHCHNERHLQEADQYCTCVRAHRLPWKIPRP